MVMDNVEEILQAVFIGIALASVLLQTSRYNKAIELFTECLVLLKQHSSKLQKDHLNKLYALVYHRLFKLYCLIADYKNSIQWGEKALLVFHENGDSEREAVLLDEMGDIYVSIGEQGKAKENYEKALSYYHNEVSKLKRKENFKEILGTLLVNLGDYSMALFEYDNAKEYFEQALKIFKETYNEEEEGRTTSQRTEELNKLCAPVNYRLFDLYCLVGDYENAIQSGETFSRTSKFDGDFESGAELLEKMGDLYQHTGEKVKAKERYEMAFAMYSVMSLMFSFYGTPVIEPKEHLNKMLIVATKTGNKEREGQLLNQLGELALSSFEYSKAMEYFEKELEIWKETGNRKEEGKALRCLGNLYRKTEEYDKAKQHYEEAMTILEETGEMEYLGVASGELGKVYNTLREFKKAKTLQKQAIEISVKIGDKRGESEDYRSLAYVHTNLGECNEAEKCYQKALAISKETGDRKGEALTYSGLGGFYSDLNEFEKAVSYCKKALAIYKEIGDLQNEGSENSDLGELYRRLGRYDEARKCHERALAIEKEIGDRRGEGGTYCNLGTIYQSLGDYDKAKECHEQALAISKETNHLRGQGVDYGNLGTVCVHLGDYDMAYEYFKNALEISIRTGNSEGITAAYNHLGVVCQHRGEYAKAEKFCQKALANSKKIGNKENEVSSLCNLASIETNIGELEKAKTFYEEALQISKEIGDIRQEAVMNGNLGNVYKSLGDLTTAKRFFEKSLTIMKPIGCKDLVGTVLGNLGTLCESLGDYTKAREYYEEARTIAVETRDQKGEMTMNNNLGTLHLSQKEFQKALDCFKKALAICEQMGDLHAKSVSYCHMAVVYMVRQDIPRALSFLSASIKILEEMRPSIGECEHYKIGFADKNADPYRLMATVLLKLGCVNTALSITELARGRSLAELMATQYSCQHLIGFDTTQWTDFGNFIQEKSCTCLSFWFVYGSLYCWIITAGRKEIYREVGSNTGHNTAKKNVTVCPVESWIDTLVSQGVRMFPDLLEGKWEDRSLTVLRCRLEVESHVTENLATFRLIEEDSDNENVQGRDRAALKVLYDMLIAPVSDLLVGSEIIIVPDRSLFKVPFAALIDESGEYLSEKYIIRFAPSLTTLKLIQDSPADYHSGTGALIVGDPDVGTVRYQGRKVYISRLPFAKQEVKMIGQLLDVHPLIGKQANKETVLQTIHSVGLIHIAAHGDAERGSIALSPSNKEKDDFLLTMSDISKVQLRAKLVVLSCCHSGCGQIKAEGVVGIARAFLGSGARSVLVSLWAVDDCATMQFMKQFYGHLVGGKSASQSLHETMKWMRGSSEYSEVRKWAPFMLIGDDVSFDFSK